MIHNKSDIIVVDSGKSDIIVIISTKYCLMPKAMFY